MSFLGIGQIYRGKLEESSVKTGGGVAIFGLGAIGLSFMNPLFSNTVLNLVTTAAFTALSMGLIGWMFKDTHCDITYASLEAMPPENDTPNPLLENNHLDTPVPNTGMPVTLDVQYSEKAYLPVKPQHK